jgi:hypothetical protein
LLLPRVRVFDVMPWTEAVDRAYQMDDLQRIAHWRDNGGQPFLSNSALTALCLDYELGMVPPIWVGDASGVPTGIPETKVWLESLFPENQSRCRLDENAPGLPEGMVLRTADRTSIRKLRFEDYKKTVR